jgi:nucleotide-binding universal stress UspA family protein
MYKVIMVPTDGSGFDREAIRVALEMAERSNAKSAWYAFSRVTRSSERYRKLSGRRWQSSLGAASARAR